VAGQSERAFKIFYSYDMSIMLRYAEFRNQASEMFYDTFMKVFNNI